MDQLSIFDQQASTPDLPQHLVEYSPSIFSVTESAHRMEVLINKTNWVQKEIVMYGKRMITPRLTAWYGDPGANYAFSGSKFSPLPWLPELLEIKSRIEPLSDTKFNSVLLNYYRDGNDSVAWHSDDERELGTHPVIASVSFGQTRQFDIRKKDDHTRRYSIKLETGSLLLMKGNLQRHWEHRVPKSTSAIAARLNLTFRVINS